jgi:hypothetical protein
MFGFLIESLVAILLLVTICYCIVLNNRLKRLKADEQALKATISELITATEIAERAVAGLKTTAHECDRGLGERLRSAERCGADLSRQTKSAEALIGRLSRILAAARPLESADPEQDVLPDLHAIAAAPDPQAVAAAAKAFAQRARTRRGSVAA